METGEAVAIKKVLQDRRYKNRELQLMRVMDHPNVVSLKHCFFSTTSTDELFLNLVMEYVPESMYRVLKHYNNANQRIPIIYVKLYMYQVCLRVSGDSKTSLYLFSRCLIQIYGGCEDFQGFGLYPHCSWSLPQGFEASKYTGMLINFC